MATFDWHAERADLEGLAQLDGETRRYRPRGGARLPPSPGARRDGRARDRRGDPVGRGQHPLRHRHPQHAGLHQPQRALALPGDDRKPARSCSSSPAANISPTGSRPWTRCRPALTASYVAAGPEIAAREEGLGARDGGADRGTDRRVRARRSALSG